MKRIFKKGLCLYVLMCFVALIGQVDIYAAPTVKIVVSPNQTDIEAGSDAIALTAQTSGSNLQYTWMLKGLGELSGTDLPGVFYTPPKTISGSSKTALITVVVKDTKTGQEVTESMTFKIFPATEPTPVTPSGSEKQGMSTTTKVALGVGAAALIGGGIALAAKEEEDDPSFTGSFRQEFTKTTNDGLTPMYVRNTFNLQQNGDSITGTHESVTTFGTCCTAGLTTPVTGSVDGKNAVLNWGYAVGRCYGTNCSFSIYTPGGSYAAELLENGKILNVENYGDSARQKCTEGDGSLHLIEGESTFIRE